MTDERVAVFDLCDHLRGNLAAAGHVAQEFRDIVDRVGGAMGQQKNGGGLRVGDSARFLTPDVSRLRRELLHEFAQVFDVLHRRFRQDPMAQIEDVPGPLGGAPQNIFGARLDFFPVGK